MRWDLGCFEGEDCEVCGCGYKDWGLKQGDMDNGEIVNLCIRIWNTVMIDVYMICLYHILILIVIIIAWFHVFHISYLLNICIYNISMIKLDSAYV